MMERKIDDKTETTTSWIPEKFAIRGKVIKLENRETGEQTDGWKVIMVGSKRKESDEVIERSQDYKKTRKASDI
jgi:hypothetical protein